MRINCQSIAVWFFLLFIGQNQFTLTHLKPRKKRCRSVDKQSKCDTLIRGKELLNELGSPAFHYRTDDWLFQLWVLQQGQVGKYFQMSFQVHAKRCVSCWGYFEAWSRGQLWFHTVAANQYQRKRRRIRTVKWSVCETYLCRDSKAR